jgi:hypothetical protein
LYSLTVFAIEDLVYYTLSASSSFDKHYTSSYQSEGLGRCGEPGLRAGLSFSFMAEDLGEIPYNELVEIPFAVTSMGICDSYTDISVTITATCEMPSPNSQVFQYGVLTDEDGVQSVSYNLDDRLYASNSSATFNVEWASGRRRRLTENDIDISAQFMDLGDELKSYALAITVAVFITCGRIIFFLSKKQTEERKPSPAIL